MENIVYYVMDAVFFVMFIHMYVESKKVVLETKEGNKFIIPGMLVAVALLGFLNYSGFFSWFQFFFMVGLAAVFFFMKSGLAETGVVMSGAMMPFEKISRINVNRINHCLQFMYKKRLIEVYFSPEQMNDVREFIKDRSKPKE